MVTGTLYRMLCWSPGIATLGLFFYISFFSYLTAYESKYLPGYKMDPVGGSNVTEIIQHCFKPKEEEIRQLECNISLV